MHFGMIQRQLNSLRLALSPFAAGMSAFSPAYAQQKVISTNTESQVEAAEGTESMFWAWSQLLALVATPLARMARL